MYFYADAATQRVLRASESIVLLYGGFEGFENYGDVLQLKSTIEFHRRTTGLRPVLVVSLACCLSRDVPEQIRAKYNVDGVIYEDGDLLDVAALGLAPIDMVRGGALLHVYGGGYFNRFWGAHRAFVCEQLIFALHLSDYVMSGLQVDEDGAGHLARLFALRMPLVIGGRDARSVELLRAVAPPERVRFSFDDAVEAIDAIRTALTATGAFDDALRESTGMHFNITREYMSPAQARAVESVFSTTVQRRPAASVTLLQAYNDRRGLVEDTLETISRANILGRLTSFGVVDLATLSAAPAPTAGELRAVARSLAAVDVVVACSYHVALTMNLLGRPTFLVASNDYYADKRTALGLPAEIGAFLDDPPSSLRDFAAERRERLEWLAMLSATVATRSARRKKAAVTRESREVIGTVAEKYFLS
ncbi:MAG: hypothetical protein ABIS08_01355 [Pseudolysinimonas sp.]